MIFLAILFGTFAAANADTVLSNEANVSKPIKASQALKASKVFKCTKVSLQENASGTGLTLKKVKRSKDFLVLDVKEVESIDDVTLKCVEVEKEVTANGIKFSRK